MHYHNVNTDLCCLFIAYDNDNFECLFEDNKRKTMPEKGWGGVNKQKFWHCFQLSFNYACKDFQFETWLENRLQRASIFPLAANPEISSTTLKTFCPQSIRCYSHSHWRQDNNCRLSAFQWAVTYWCKNGSGFVLLMWLSLKPPARPSVKVTFKSW